MSQFYELIAVLLEIENAFDNGRDCTRSLHGPGPGPGPGSGLVQMTAIVI
jgi:hypothetical protein